jgi:4-hydroxy-tetrahydrodipicolinate reductase
VSIKIAIAGVTGWTGSAVARKLLELSQAEQQSEFQLVSAIARGKAGQDVAEALGNGLATTGVKIVASVVEALTSSAGVDVLIDYTTPESVKAHALTALEAGVRVVIGTSGLTATDYQEIEQKALAHKLGVIAAGNFSITAALAKHFALIAAKYLPSWEIIDYASATKRDAPSGTTRELAEALAEVAQNKLAMPLEQLIGPKEIRGANIAGTQVHSVRLLGYVIAFETLFGLPDERLTIRHDAGNGADPYVGGTLLATQRVMEVTGLVRGLDQLLFRLSL